MSPSPRRHERPSMFESLESRTLLAAFVGVPISDAPADITGANGNHTIFFTSPRSPSSGGISTQQVQIDGQWHRVADLPGFGHSSLLSAADNSGRLAGFTPGSGGTEWFFVINGVRTTLADSITSWVGVAGDPSKMAVDEIADNGWSLLIQDYRSTPDQRTWTWRLKDGTATFLGKFSGTINDLGTVLPQDAGTQDEIPRVLFLADGTQVPIPGLGNYAVFGLGIVLSDDNTLAWLDSNATGIGMKTWKNGTIDYVRFWDPDPYIMGVTVFREAMGLNTEGRFLGRVRIGSKYGDGPPSYFLYDPAAGVHYLTDISWGTGFFSPAFHTDAVRLSNDNTITMSNGVLAPIGDAEPWLARDGTPLTAGASEGLTVFGGINKFGDAVVFTRSGSQWDGHRVVGEDPLHPPASPQTDIKSVLAYLDPVDGAAQVFVITSTRVLRDRVPTTRGDAAYVTALFLNTGWTYPVDHTTLFVSTDHRVQLAGTDADGDLVLFYERDPDTPAHTATWRFANLTADHLEANGKTFAPVASGLTAFVSPWGAMHIAYLDSAGDVQVVWWAPGLTYWTTDNLSQIAGAAPLHGSLTSYVTAWNGLNVAGTDADGNLVALWWVPQFGSVWKYERYVGDGAAKLGAGSLTSFVTPWGSLNVVGLDATTRAITVYWWTPATNEWRVEPIAVAGGASSITARSAPVAATPTPDGLLQIFFTGEDLHMDRLYWTPGDGAAWNFEDVSAAV